MPKNRKVDKLAGKRPGFLKALKARRKSVETGTIEGLRKAPQKFVTALGGKKR